MVLPRHCCSPWTKSAVSEFADLVGVSVSLASVIESVEFGVSTLKYLFFADCSCKLAHRYIFILDVRPPNDHVSYPGDQPWHVPFPSPPLTPNHDPTSSGSEAESNDPLHQISAVKHELQYLCKATDWGETKCDIHGQVKGNLANKLNKAYAGEVKQTLKAKSRSKELESLKLKLEDTKKNAVQQFRNSEEYNHEMVECFNNGFEIFRDYASVVSPDYNWSEIDVAGVWQVLNTGGEGMAHHSLVHKARMKAKDMDLLMDL
ncbi:hypothetical protein ACE6H2_016349 [Prunus campanulata]